MKFNSKFLVVGLVALGIGLGTNNLAFSETDLKIGIVDIPQVVSKSAQVEALKKEQIKKAEDFKKFVDKAKADISKQTTDDKKRELAAKYEKQIADRQAAEAKEYTKKLSEIDKNISATINSTARARGYDLIFAKGTLLYGGEDITEMISKSVK